ncbi:MAG TPA: hypothetical protein V6C71_18530 [Coleofasciculaceae cyanobacterium]|jgi:hypothetical protein
MAQLTLNLVQGAVSFNFSIDAAKQLQAEISTLMQSLKAIAGATSSAASRPARQESMEYRYTGDVFLEIFCNPNIYPSPFAAKILITLRDDRIRLTSEAELTQLIEDLNVFLEG